ncbi:MAG: hypothetical protein M5U12_32720 [Verrucomicrobia bacterium]|nr:hypothetical protein [Verrucomicrobiota bacterium]
MQYRKQPVLAIGSSRLFLGQFTNPPPRITKRFITRATLTAGQDGFDQLREDLDRVAILDVADPPDGAIVQPSQRPRHVAEIPVLRVTSLWFPNEFTRPQVVRRQNDVSVLTRWVDVAVAECVEALRILAGIQEVADRLA